MSLVRISRDLARAVRDLDFAPPVAFVYRPLDYAQKPHRLYLERWGDGVAAPGRTLLVGMNPGPWGMAQTGVPFGAVSWVRDWLGIAGPVGKPEREHPKKPVEGFACTREEVSGARLWGWAAATWKSPERFFARFFVANYCPLLFLDDAGRNLTPDQLSAGELRVVTDPCNQALRRTVRALGAERVVGVGAFAEQRVRAVLGDSGLPLGGVLHPSPASPRANRGWAEIASAQIRALGVQVP